MELPKLNEQHFKGVSNECPDTNLWSCFNPESRSYIKAVREIVNIEIKEVKPNSRFAPYPIHQRLFVQQQHEQERRRQSMVTSLSRPTKISKSFNENMLRTSRAKELILNKIISFMDKYSHRMCSKPNDFKEKCVVCMYNYQENEELRILQCNHKFHRKCVDKWLVKTHLCPVCRTELMAARH